MTDLALNQFHMERLLLLQGSAVIAALLFLSFTLSGTPAIAQAPEDAEEEEEQKPEQENEFSAHGFDLLRIEQEDKLSVPLDRREEVWNFLCERFVRDTTALKKLDPLLSSHFNEEVFIDTYFDSPDLQMLALQSAVRHRKRIDPANASSRKSERDFLQIKINDRSLDTLAPRELKFEIRHSGEFKHLEDKYPLLGMIKLSQREDCKQQLKALGLEPYAMRPILTVHDQRWRIYILRHKKSFISISLDHVTSAFLWAKVEFVEIEPELNEIAFTEADSVMRKHMEEIGAKISAEITTAFPDIKSDLTPKYNKSFNRFEVQIPFLKFLIRADLDDPTNLLVTSVVSLAGVIIGGIFLIKRFSSTK